MFLLLGINPNLQIHVGFLRVCEESGGGRVKYTSMRFFQCLEILARFSNFVITEIFKWKDFQNLELDDDSATSDEKCFKNENKDIVAKLRF